MDQCLVFYLPGMDKCAIPYLADVYSHMGFLPGSGPGGSKTRRMVLSPEVCLGMCCHADHGPAPVNSSATFGQ